MPAQKKTGGSASFLSHQKKPRPPVRATSTAIHLCNERTTPGVPTEEGPLITKYCRDYTLERDEFTLLELMRSLPLSLFPTRLKEWQIILLLIGMLLYLLNIEINSQTRAI